MQELNKKIKNQTKYGLLYKTLAVLVSFVSVPVLFNYLGKQSYGIWVTIASILNWFMIFDFGLGLGLRNKLNESITIKDFKVSKSLIISSYTIIGLITLVLCILFFGLNFLLKWNDILNTSFLDNIEFRYIIIVAFTGFCLSFVLQIIYNLFYALHDASKVELLKLSRQTIVFVPLLFLAKSENNFNKLMNVSYINSFLPIIVFILFTIYFFKKHQYIFPKLSDFSYSHGLSVIKLGGNFFIIRLSSLFLVTLLPFLITKFLGANQTADFNIAFKYLSIVQMVFIIFLNPYWSAVTEKFSIGDYVWIKKSLRTTLFISFVGLFLVIILLFLSPYILPLWIGEELDINFTIICWVALLVGVFIITEPYLIFLNGIGNIKIQTYYSILIIICLIPCNIFLFKFCNLGFSSFIITPVFFRLLRSIHAAFQIKFLLIEK
jgi:O-antigen/teichoic acid export membrane protein